MPNSMINIDYLSINVVIYKKVDDDFVFVDFNKQAELTDDLDKKSLINKKLTEVFPKVKEYGFFDVLVKVNETGLSETFQSPHYIDDKIICWRKKEIYKLENGNVAVFYTDSSFEKLLEEQLSKTESLLEHQKTIFQEIIENSDAIAVQGYNQDHEVIYWNKGSERLYGYSKEEALGKKLEELIVPETDKEFVYKSVQDWLDKDIPIKPSELTLQDKDGNPVYVYSNHALIRVSDALSEMYCIDIDLNEIKLLQKELLEQKRFLHAIFDVIPDIVWLKDLDGKYLKCNAMFERLYGASESLILGRTDFDFVNKELADFFRKNDQLALKQGSSRVNEEYLTFADGSHEGHFETIKTPMKNEDGEIIGVLGVARDINERKKKEKQLEISANYDNLTGLANRALFMDRLQELLKKRHIEGRQHSLLFIDLDHFKEINDTIGHSAGDEVLIETAKRITKSVRKGDAVSRLGGDEFTVLLENIRSKDEVQNIAEKILQTLRKPFYVQGHELHITVSIGISISPDDTITPDTLLQYADKAMYRAKEKSKDSYEFYS